MHAQLLIISDYLITGLLIVAGIVVMGFIVRKLILWLFARHWFFTYLSKAFYNFFYTIKKTEHLRTNNFGYAPVDEEISAYDSDLRYGLQLYKELVKTGDGYAIDSSQTVVEVGCGKGAGAAFLSQKLQPFRYTGVDYSKKAVAFCQSNYADVHNTNFVCADAHQLPFADSSVDLVLNVESSHLYKHTSGFFQEVSRVLKSKGKFLYTDYRYIKHYPISRIEEELRDAGFTITEKKTITPHIREACALASDRREELVAEIIPKYLRKYFRYYAILTGTKKFRMLENGEINYFMFHLEKR
jgi:ubiquinone/menaquinone biosynthesis C-methylase UbiE